MQEVYMSGWLVLALVGLCAVVIIGQLVPAILLLVGAINAVKSGEDKKK
jgi:hypothetical protein